MSCLTIYLYCPRYPKHVWPLDPLNTEATRLTKKVGHPTRELGRSAAPPARPFLPPACLPACLLACLPAFTPTPCTLGVAKCTLHFCSSPRPRSSSRRRQRPSPPAAGAAAAAAAARGRAAVAAAVRKSGDEAGRPLPRPLRRPCTALLPALIPSNHNACSLAATGALPAHAGRRVQSHAMVFAASCAPQQSRALPLPNK